MTRRPGTDPFRARRWREQGTGGAYSDMAPEVRPEGTPPDPDRGRTQSMPEGGSVATILDWVGTDRSRAQVAYDFEWSRTTQRQTLLAELRKLLT